MTKKPKFVKTIKKAYYVEFGTKGTIGTVYAKNLVEAKRKAKTQVTVRARGNFFSK
jgi:hypothetical protein